MDLRNGDCLEILKDITDNTIDLVFADLPYGQVNCKWDCKIDLKLLWIELLRVAKNDNTPFFFTCTTKFGYELIKSNEKMFKYDLVWYKSAPCGFLQAKKQPMRKHEMIYVFYKKPPLYDISSHTHKFKKEKEKEKEIDTKLKSNGTKGVYPCDNKYRTDYQKQFGFRSKNEPLYDPPLPTTVIKEDEIKKEYEPPLPVSVIKEEREIKPKNSNKGGLYSKIDRLEDIKYDPPLPTTVIKEDEIKKEYEPPLPSSVLEIKSIRLKQHSTAKPPDLMKWILKYHTKEGDLVLDPTMGSNAMGVACKEMNRSFIGIEKDPEIYKFACERLE